ncbi:MAG: ATP-dependent DNA helicase RecG [Planctomycetes bacterium]|nr:ATP-dependent DNA helicase RecG [Planctomycetota bacterium]
MRRLSKPVQYLKGVGPRLMPMLNKLGLVTARDVLFFFPRDYEDFTAISPIAAIDGSGPVTVCGDIEESELSELGGGRTVFGALLRDATGVMRAVWFNQPYMQSKVVSGRRVMFSGLPRRRGLCWEISHPRVVPLADGEQPAQGEMLPVYPLTEGLAQSRLRTIVRQVVEEFAGEIEEVFPEAYLAEHDLLPVGRALRAIHGPRDRADVRRARRRFVYQELLVLQLALALRRWNLQLKSRALALPATAKIDARIRRLFPFELTGDQQRAIAEIAADMGREFPMNRLLQGEVGSGKTVVAEYAMLLAVAHGCQAVIMTPTEVLARQHFRTLGEDLRQSRVRMALLTGSLSPGQRSDIYRALREGEIDLLVGTQAVLHEAIGFHRLGLVVIDEQHKFGVQQRAALRDAGTDPHYLVMTATPIPRTVTMSLFGDLDVSTLRQPPPGRQPVHTYLGVESQRERWWEFVRGKLRDGRQAYVITPRVEEAETEDVPSVEQVFERMTNGPFEAFRADLIHGRMSAAEKDAAMDSFHRGQTQVLVATSVVEVGVDVPNATLMTIEGGERFGLAQLHQLRGRVQRGAFPGFVCVFAQPANQAARDRLNAFVRLTDGFELAEIDFALRGPGDLFGTRQHGMPPLRVADLQRDQEILEEARLDAQALVARADHPLQQPAFALLNNRVLRRYGDALGLADVG